MAKKVKCLVLLSGGLDSLLAVKVLQAQGIQVETLTFKSYFFDPVISGTRKIDFSKEHLQIVKKPPHGYGKAANPCVDCHLLMLQKAKEILEKEGYDFVATGEILGERPFSQNKAALLEIAQKSGLGDRLLRPLSAKFLPPTLPQKRGWIDVSKLPAIKGRSRKIQLTLAKKYGLKDFPQPAGGCLLTDPIFGKKLLTLFEKWPQATGDDVALLKLGRHSWNGQTLIVLGRNQQENQKLEKLVKKQDTLLVPKNFAGPSALVRGRRVGDAAIKKAKELISQYSKRQPPHPIVALATGNSDISLRL